MNPNVPSTQPQSPTMPPPPTPPVSHIETYTASNSKMPGPRSKMKMILLIAIPIIVVILIAVALLPVYANVKYPFLSQGMRKSLVLFFNAIPLIPKTNEQILIGSAESNFQIYTYTPDFSLSAQLQGSSVTLGSLDLHINGPADITPKKKPSFDLNVTAGLNFAGTQYDFSGKAVKVEDTYYLKVDKLPDTLVSTLSQMTGVQHTASEKAQIDAQLQQALTYWIKYDTTGLPTEARKALEPSHEDTVAESSRKSFEDFLLNNDILSQVKREPDESVNNVSTYHLSLNPDKPLLRTIIQKYVGLNKDLSATQLQQLVTLYSNSLDKISINIWIGKSDSVMRKVTFAAEINLASLSQPSNANAFYLNSPTANTTSFSPSDYMGLLGGSQIGSAKLEIATALVLNKIGEPVHIVIPSPTESFTDYAKNLTNSLKTKEELAQEQKLALVDADLQTIDDGLNKYYADNLVYPTSLSVSLHLTKTLNNSLSTYQYKTGTSQKKFALYTQSTSKILSASMTPYYGITSDYAYPHQLTTMDFDSLTSTAAQPNYNFLLAPLLNSKNK